MHMKPRLLKVSRGTSYTTRAHVDSWVKHNIRTNISQLANNQVIMNSDHEGLDLLERSGRIGCVLLNTPVKCPGIYSTQG